MSTLQRLLRRTTVDRATGCWNWTGAKTSAGYGSAKVDGRSQSTHRVVYLEIVGPIPDGLTLDHLCRNPICANPGHLKPVTRGENCRRGVRTKLTLEQIAEIRASAESHSALARRLGRGISTVRQVRTGERWRGVDGVHA